MSRWRARRWERRLILPGGTIWSGRDSFAEKWQGSPGMRINSRGRLENPMFRYHEGETVAVRQDWAELGLKAGDTGTIWALYNIEPPAYEVTFRTSEGESFDMTLTE